MPLRRLPHTLSLLLMPPLNFRSQSSLSGASTPMTLWIAWSHHRQMETPAVAHFSNPLTSPPSTVQHQPHQWSFGSTRAAPLCATASARSRGSSLLALLTWDPSQSSASSTLYAGIYLSFVPATTCKYTQLETHANSSTVTCIRSASTALAGTHNAVGPDPRTGSVFS